MLVASYVATAAFNNRAISDVVLRSDKRWDRKYVAQRVRDNVNVKINKAASYRKTSSYYNGRYNFASQRMSFERTIRYLFVKQRIRFLNMERLQSPSLYSGAKLSAPKSPILR